MDEKDTQIALRSDDLTISRKHAKQLEYAKNSFQGEIREKDQEIQQRHEKIQELIVNRHVPRGCGIDNVLYLEGKERQYFLEKFDDFSRYFENWFFLNKC